MKLSKKFFAISLTLCMIFVLSISAFADAVEITDSTAFETRIEAAKVAPGENLIANVYISTTEALKLNGHDFTSVSLSFSYPDILTTTKASIAVSEEAAALGFAIDDVSSFVEDGYLAANATLTSGSVTIPTDKPIFVITFKVSDEAADGTYAFTSEDDESSISDGVNGKTATSYVVAESKFEIGKSTPAVNKYNVTFTGYDSKNMTDVEENTVITLPDAPAVGENEVFKGWNDGTTTYDAGAKYPVTKDVTFKAVIETVVPQPVKAETKVESEKVRDLTYDTDKTSHFFEGIYSVTPNDEKIATFGVNIKSKADTSKTKTFEKKGLTVEGGAKIVLRLALINDDVAILNDLAGDVFYTAE